MLLEILKHHGPARLGRLEHEDCVIPTPNFFSIIARGIEIEHDIYIASYKTKTSKAPVVIDYGSLRTEKAVKAFGILPDERVSLNVPREIAEYSVEKTLGFAQEYQGYGAVVQGSRYPDLREKCALALKHMPLVAVADGRFLDNPRLAVEIVSRIREAVSPNTALYFPFAPPHMFYLLAYMGVDFFDSGECMVMARGAKLITTRGFLSLNELKEIPCTCSICRDRGVEELKGDFNALLSHNFNTALQIIREIREGMRMGTLRELVEEKASGSPLPMAMLRILDKEKQDFLERYTPVVP